MKKTCNGCGMNDTSSVKSRDLFIISAISVIIGIVIGCVLGAGR